MTSEGTPFPPPFGFRSTPPPRLAASAAGMQRRHHRMKVTKFGRLAAGALALAMVTTSCAS